MNASSTQSADVVLQSDVLAYGVVQARFADLPRLRHSPGPLTGRELPPRLLHHADEQTVAGLAAVLRAIDRSGMHCGCFEEWGVLAAPRYPGRRVCAITLPRFREIGAPAISPHIIPQHSLHSLPGAISVALGMHGPNFGIGGGRAALAEGLLAALSFVDECVAPGLWLVLTEWSPELAPDERGSPRREEPVCHAVAMALVPPCGCPMRIRATMALADLRNERHRGTDAFHPSRPDLLPVDGGEDFSARDSESTELTGVAALAEHLSRLNEMNSGGRRDYASLSRWPVSSGCEFELVVDGASREHQAA